MCQPGRQTAEGLGQTGLGTPVLSNSLNGCAAEEAEQGKTSTLQLKEPLTLQCNLSN